MNDLIALTDPLALQGLNGLRDALAQRGHVVNDQRDLLAIAAQLACQIVRAAPIPEDGKHDQTPLAILVNAVMHARTVGQSRSNPRAAPPRPQGRVDPREVIKRLGAMRPAQPTPQALPRRTTALSAPTLTERMKSLPPPRAK